MSHALRVYLSAEERRHLEDLISKGDHSPHLLQRARILLLADRTGGEWNRYEKIAEVLQSSTSIVSSICRQYVTGGLKGALNKKPQPGRVIKITSEIESRLLSLVRSEPPEGQRYWTLKLLAEQLVNLGLVESISGVSIYKRLKKMNLSTKNLRLDASPNTVRDP